MTSIKLKYVHQFRDRHGKRRYYFRRRGYQQFPLPGLPGSEEFMAAYQAALAGDSSKRRQIGADRTRPGTIADLIVTRLQSTEFNELEPSSKSVQRRDLERLRAEHGDKPVASLQRRHVYEMVRARASTPTVGNRLLTYLHQLMQIALDKGYIDVDPTISVKRIQYKVQGFYPWTEENILQFEKHWPTGTKQRLALDLLLYTAQRGSDVRGMGPQHIKNGVISLVQQKTRARVDIPVHPRLRQSLDALPVQHLTFLVTEFGQPFSVKGFQQWFVKAAKAAGLPDGASAHGLRKAASRRLAEAGCSDRQIMAITGHKTNAEVNRYTRDADRVQLAEQAMRQLQNGPQKIE